jgi:hypothetical protein
LAVKELPQPHADDAFGFTVTCTTAPKWCKKILPFLMQEFEQKGKKQKYSFCDGSSFATSDRVLSCV